MIVKWRTSGNAFIGDLRIGMAWKDGERWRFTHTSAGSEMLGLEPWGAEIVGDGMSDIMDKVQRRATEYASPR